MSSATAEIEVVAVKQIASFCDPSGTIDLCSECKKREAISDRRPVGSLVRWALLLRLIIQTNRDLAALWDDDFRQ